MAQPQPEKRATRRFSLRLPVSVKHPEMGEVPGYTRDVSSRGVCFYINTPLQVGSDLQFTLTLPSEITLTEAIKVRCHARVVRVEQGPDGAGLAVAATIDRYEFLGERR
jgi:hypothetical protein